MSRLYLLQRLLPLGCEAAQSRTVLKQDLHVDALALCLTHCQVKASVTTEQSQHTGTLEILTAVQELMNLLHAHLAIRSILTKLVAPLMRHKLCCDQDCVACRGHRLLSGAGGSASYAPVWCRLCTGAHPSQDVVCDEIVFERVVDADAGDTRVLLQHQQRICNLHKLVL